MRGWVYSELRSRRILSWGDCFSTWECVRDAKSEERSFAKDLRAGRMTAAGWSRRRTRRRAARAKRVARCLRGGAVVLWRGSEGEIYFQAGRWVGTRPVRLARGATYAWRAPRLRGRR